MEKSELEAKNVSELQEIAGGLGIEGLKNLRKGELIDAALCGADISTMPYDVFKKLVKHPLTDKGLESFEKDWAELQGELKQGTKGA